MATYTFDHWEVNGVTYASTPLNVTITADTTITAFYHETGTPPTEEPNYVIIAIGISAVAGIGLLWFLSRKK